MSCYFSKYIPAERKAGHYLASSAFVSPSYFMCHCSGFHLCIQSPQPHARDAHSTTWPQSPMNTCLLILLSDLVASQLHIGLCLGIRFVIMAKVPSMWPFAETACSTAGFIMETPVIEVEFVCCRHSSRAASAAWLA